MFLPWRLLITAYSYSAGRFPRTVFLPMEVTNYSILILRQVPEYSFSTMEVTDYSILILREVPECSVSTHGGY